MSLFLVNIGLIVGVVSLVVFVQALARSARRRRLFSLGTAQMFVDSTRDLQERAKLTDHAGDALVAMSAVRLGRTRQSYMRRMRLTFILLNAASTVAALVPVGFAVYDLIMNQQHQAFSFNLVALATLIVTKGGLFFLTWILLPAVKAVPGAVTGAIIKSKYDDWQKRRKKPSDR